MVASVANNQYMTGFLQTRMNKTNTQMQTAMSRLSSAQRINMAKDDAAGLAVAQRMLAQFNGLSMAERNAGDASSYMGVADAATSSIDDSLMRMRELAVQASNGLYSDADRQLMQQEFSQLQSQIGQSMDTATFNGTPVLSADSVDVQVGANEGDTMTMPAMDLRSDLASVLDSSFGIGTAADAAAAIGGVDSALEQVASTKATIGATSNRLDAVIRGLQSMAEAQAAAEGRIMDADYARETSRLAGTQILQQSSTAMMAQTNNMSRSFVSGLLGS